MTRLGLARELAGSAGGGLCEVETQHVRRGRASGRALGVLRRSPARRTTPRGQPIIILQPLMLQLYVLHVHVQAAGGAARLDCCVSKVAGGVGRGRQ